MPPPLPRSEIYPAPLPLRPCVGVVLFNAEGLVWVGRHQPRWARQRDDFGDTFWQLPQGGIEPREPSREAAFRELWEETGVRNAIADRRNPRLAHLRAAARAARRRAEGQVRRPSPALVRHALRRRSTARSTFPAGAATAAGIRRLAVGPACRRAAPRGGFPPVRVRRGGAGVRPLRPPSRHLDRRRVVRAAQAPHAP